MAPRQQHVRDHERSSSFEMQVSKISCNVYVTNFPKHLTQQELWNVCSKYETITNVFIAKIFSKLGKPFVFVGFIKVIDVELLIANLCTIWINGKIRLYANLARFGRTNKSTNKIDGKTNYHGKPPIAGSVDH